MRVPVTRMQDLASEFSKKFSGVILQTPQWEGATPSSIHTSPACGRRLSASAPVLGPKSWSPQLFSLVNWVE